jgi:hypothetical protein
VRKWCREFKDGRTDVHDEQRSGRPSVSDETIAKVEDTMLKDRRVTVRELCEMIPDVSKTCIMRSRSQNQNYFLDKHNYRKDNFLNIVKLHLMTRVTNVNESHDGVNTNITFFFIQIIFFLNPRQRKLWITIRTTNKTMVT